MKQGHAAVWKILGNFYEKAPEFKTCKNCKSKVCMNYVGKTPLGNCGPVKRRGRPRCPVCWYSLLNAADKKRVAAFDLARKGRTNVR